MDSQIGSRLVVLEAPQLGSLRFNTIGSKHGEILKRRGKEDRLYLKPYCLGAEKSGNKDVHQITRTDVCFSGDVTAGAW